MQTNELKKKYEEYLQTLIEEIKSEKSSETLLGYLDFCSRFHRYSFNNKILIWMSMPKATNVAGFHSWKKLGRLVKKGEKGIPIFAPIRVKKKLDPADNKGITEEDENAYQEQDKLFFKVVYVWDVSQTEGEQFCVLAHELAHEYLHKGTKRPTYSKKLKETEAEATAYIVCRHFGVNPKSSTYLAIYQTEDIDIQGSFGRITSTASRILRGIENATGMRKAA